MNRIQIPDKFQSLEKSGKVWESLENSRPRIFQNFPDFSRLWNLSGICLEFVWVGSSKSKVDRPKHMCLVDRGRPGPKNTLPSPLPLPLVLPHTPTHHPYYPSPTHTLTPTRTDTPSFRSLGVGPLVGPPTKRNLAKKLGATATSF